MINFRQEPFYEETQLELEILNHYNNSERAPNFEGNIINVYEFFILTGLSQFISVAELYFCTDTELYERSILDVDKAALVGDSLFHYWSVQCTQNVTDMSNQQRSQLREVLESNSSMARLVSSLLSPLFHRGPMPVLHPGEHKRGTMLECLIGVKCEKYLSIQKDVIALSFMSLLMWNEFGEYRHNIVNAIKTVPVVRVAAKDLASKAYTALLYNGVADFVLRDHNFMRFKREILNTSTASTMLVPKKISTELLDNDIKYIIEKYVIRRMCKNNVTVKQLLREKENISSLFALEGIDKSFINRMLYKLEGHGYLVRSLTSDTKAPIWKMTDIYKDNVDLTMWVPRRDIRDIVDQAWEKRQPMEFKDPAILSGSDDTVVEKSLASVEGIYMENDLKSLIFNHADELQKPNRNVEIVYNHMIPSDDERFAPNIAQIFEM